MRPQEDCVLAIVHGQLGDCDVFTFLERLGQQRIRTASGFLRHHVIRRLEIDGIDFTRFHEFENLHRLRSLGLDLLDLFRLDDHIFVLAIFIALHDLAAVEHLVV